MEKNDTDRTTKNLKEHYKWTININRVLDILPRLTTKIRSEIGTRLCKYGTRVTYHDWPKN